MAETGEVEAGRVAANRLAGRRALITGAAGGQGRAVAVRFAADGAQLALVDVDGPGLDATRRAVRGGPGVLTMTADVRDEGAVASVVGRAVEALGGLDVLYNNAGVYWPARDATVDRLTLDVWTDVMAVNATGAYLFCKHALPHLLASRRGVIVNVASTAAYAGDPDCHAYAASKGALLALTRSIAQRFGPDGLRAVTLCPGFVDTPMVGFALDDEPTLERIRSAIALRRVGRPEEVAAVAAFLVSDDAAYMTSCLIDVHGGLVK